MKIIKGIDNYHKDKDSYNVLTIGNFDGIHSGHRAILERVVKEARKRGGKGIVFTFDPHPIEILFPCLDLKFISSFEEKVGLIKEIGIDEVICINFDSEFAEQEPYEFVKSILWEKVGVKEIIIGKGYTFGKDKKGTVGLLREIGRELHFQVEDIKPVTIERTVVSSSRIRRLLAEGEIKDAARLLGRRYSIEGIIIKGTKKGRKLGFPTANISPPSFLSIPKNGVYAVTSEIDKEKVDGVAYIGTQPTFGQRERNIEVHIINNNFNYNEDLYKKRLKVTFIEKLRDEMVFKDKESLIRHINIDIKMARDILVRDK
ncbi:MAG: bifunctional riboflavin kinase/FAD synthetase [Nitrospirota bacterium]